MKRPKLARGADLVLALGVVASVATLLVPLPTALLDALLGLNLAVSLLLLLVALYVPSAMAMAALPTVLVLTTLYRLSLDVAAARLILGRADAGRVIRAFGQLMVQGNFVVGAVVFAVITAVQYLVIARGGERIAEVAARFALDALPGRQMSIDAEVRAGATTAAQARIARTALTQESAFYGAMDGAMKFVKGDAIAGILIAAVNLVGGVAIGVFQRHLAPGEAVQRYGVLTIGQGLVAQVPALLMAATAVLVVTRGGSDGRHGSLGRAIAFQIGGHPMPFAVVSGLMLALACVPSVPALPFAGLAVLSGAVALMLVRTPLRNEEDAASELVLWTSRPVDLEALRAALEARFTPWGIRVPPVSVRTRKGDAWTLELRGEPIASGTEDDVATALEAQRVALVGVEETQRRVDELAETHASLVRAVVPRVVEIPVLTAVLRRLLEERVPIANLHDVFEALAQRRESTHDVEVLVAMARKGLRRVITQRAAREGVVRVWRLSGEGSAMLRASIRRSAAGESLRIDPEVAERLRGDVRARGSSAPFVLLAEADVRRHAWAVLAPVLAGGVVVTPDELLEETPVEVLGAIGPA